MKDKIQLEREQAEMRARHTMTRVEPDAQPSPDPPPSVLALADKHLVKRRLAATALVYYGWSPADIARVFRWPPDAVEAWFNAGETLL